MKYYTSILLFCLLLLSLLPGSVRSEVAEFAYSRPVTLTNSGTMLSDYQVRFTLNTARLVAAGRMRDDCVDLRFTAADGETILEYWLESGANTASTSVWVKVPSIPSGDSTIYLYYGNPSASNLSSGEETFDLFDDFSRTSVGENWIGYSDSGPWSIDSNRLKVTDTNNSGYSYLVNTQAQFSNQSSFVLESRMYFGGGATWAGLVIWSDGSSSHHHLDFNRNRYCDRATSTALESPPVPGVAADTWYNVKMVYLASNKTLSWYNNGTLAFSDPLTGSTAPASGYMGVVGNYHTGYVLWDYIRVRKYAATEPTVRLGMELKRWEGEEDWTGRRLIAVDGEMIDKDLAEFPVLVRLDSDDDWSGFSGGGADIRFVDFAGEWELPYEIETWDSGVEAAIWVGCPLLSIGEGVCFWMRFGNADAASGERAAEVWNPEFRIIQHLSETGGTYQDSTAFGPSGTVVGSPTRGVAGIAGGAVSFDGGNRYIDYGSSPHITGDQTIGIWLKPGAINARRNPYDKAYGGEGSIVQETDGRVTYYSGTHGGNGTPYQSSRTIEPVVTSKWIHLISVRDTAGSPQKLRWYVNGVLDSRVDAIYGTAASTATSLLIGTGYTSPYLGLIDELRVSDVPRTAAWAKAEYYSLSGELLVWRPADLRLDGEIDPENVTNLDPVFTAVFAGPALGREAGKYRLQVSRNADFSDLAWESGPSGTAITAVSDGETCAGISYAGENLHNDGRGYWWRIKFWDDQGEEGEWSKIAFFTMSDLAPSAPTALQVDGLVDPSGLSNLAPGFSAVFNDPEPGDSAERYRIEVRTKDDYLAGWWQFDETAGGTVNDRGPGKRDGGYLAPDSILFLKYGGYSGHPLKHDSMIEDYNPGDLREKELRTEINIPAQSLEDGVNYFFTAWFRVENPGEWRFALDGDDAVELEIDGKVVADRYGGHGFCNCYDYNGTVDLTAGWHKLTVRHEEDGGGEGIILYFQAPGNGSWQVFSVANLAGKARLYAAIPPDSAVSTYAFIEKGISDLPRSVAGRFGAALEYDGIDDYLTLPHIALDNRDFSISVWVRLNAAGKNQGIVSQDGLAGSSTDKRFHLMVSSDNRVRLCFYGDDLNGPTGAVEADRWYHIAATYRHSDRERRIYIDGELYASDIATSSYLGTSGATLVGRILSRPEESFDGVIDELKILQRILDPEEVEVLYQEGADYGLAWDSGSGGSTMIPVTEGERSGEISRSIEPILTDGATYTWRIKFWDAAGNEGEWSEEASFSMLDSVPLAPTNLQTSGWTNPTGLADLPPEFSGTFNDPEAGDQAYYYQVWMWKGDQGMYHRTITIDNAGGSEELLDYQVRVDLDASIFDYSRVNADGSDLRFLDLDGSNLSYWIEDLGYEGDTTIWVKVPRISAFSVQTINLYYGNSAAVSRSDGKDTLDFFDDFSVNSLGGNWVVEKGTPTIAGGELRLDPGDGVYNNQQRNYLNLRWRGLLSNTTNNAWQGWNTTGGLNGAGVNGTVRSNTGVPSGFNFGGGGAECSETIDLGNPDPSNGAWHNFEIIWNSKAKNMRLYIDDVQRAVSGGCNKVYSRIMVFMLWAGSGVDKVDWVMLRKSAPLEPVVSVNDDEQSVLVWDSGMRGMDPVTAGDIFYLDYAGPGLHTDGATYYWRIKFWDAAGNESPWSEPAYFGMVYSLPTAPTELRCEGAIAPQGVLNLTPKFTAIFNDPEVGDTAEYFQVEVSRAAGFGDLVWNSGEVWGKMAAVTAGERSPEISYGGDRLYTDGSQYWWRVRFRDRTGNESPWSEGATFTMFDSVPTAPTSLKVEGETSPGAVTTLKPGLCAVFNDPESGDTALAYQVAVYESGWSSSPVWDSGWTGMESLANEGSFCLNFPGEGVIFNGTTYYWQIRFEDATGNEGVWSDPGEFTMADYTSPPLSPDTLLVNGDANPFYEVYQKPVFTAVYRDEDATDLAEKYRIQVSRRADFATVAWDSGEAGEEMERLEVGEVCGGIPCGGFLSPDGVYYWRIKFWDIEGYEGEWSTEEASIKYDLGQTSSDSFILECWGMNEGGTANYPAGKRQQISDPYYYLVDSVGPEAVSLGTNGAPHLASDTFHGYSHLLFAGLDTTAPSSPGVPETEPLTWDQRPVWTWTPAADNLFGSGLDLVGAYLVFWSRDEVGTEHRDRVESVSYTPAEDLDFGGWYFKVAAVDREGNQSALSDSGYVNILATTPTPTPTPSVTPSPTMTLTPSPSVTPTVTPTAVPTATPDGGCKIDLKLYLHGYLNELTLAQRVAAVNVEFRKFQNQAGEYACDLNLDIAGRTGERDLWNLTPNSYYLLIRQKLSGNTFDGQTVPLGANHYAVVSAQPRDFVLGVVTGVDFSDSESEDFLGVYTSAHEQASNPMIAVGTSGRYWMLGGGDADGNQLINVADILKWDTLVGFPDADDRGEERFSEQGNFDGNDKIDGYDFNVWKRMVNEGATYAPLPLP